MACSDVGQVGNLRPIGNRPADVGENLAAKYTHSLGGHESGQSRLAATPEEFPGSSAMPIDNRPEVNNLPHMSQTLPLLHVRPPRQRYVRPIIRLVVIGIADGRIDPLPPKCTILRVD